MSMIDEPQIVVPPETWVRDMPWLDREDADIDAYVASLPAQPDYDLTDALRRWRRDGMIVFENVVSGDLIDKYLEDTEREFEACGVPMSEANPKLWEKIQKLKAEMGAIRS